MDKWLNWIAKSIGEMIGLVSEENWFTLALDGLNEWIRYKQSTNTNMSKLTQTATAPSYHLILFPFLHCH